MSPRLHVYVIFLRALGSLKSTITACLYRLYITWCLLPWHCMWITLLYGVFYPGTVNYNVIRCLLPWHCESHCYTVSFTLALWIILLYGVFYPGTVNHTVIRCLLPWHCESHYIICYSEANHEYRIPCHAIDI